MNDIHLIKIGKNKNGQFDFSISLGISKLSFEEMQSLRAISVVALATAEENWKKYRKTNEDCVCQN